VDARVPAGMAGGHQVEKSRYGLDMGGFWLCDESHCHNEGRAVKEGRFWGNGMKYQVLFLVAIFLGQREVKA